MRGWLKCLRKDLGYSQGETAKLLGVSRQSYCFIENGNRQTDMSLSLMVKISEVFNITLDEIKQFELNVKE